jgi:hypothetical protein
MYALTSVICECELVDQMQVLCLSFYTLNLACLCKCITEIISKKWH